MTDRQTDKSNISMPYHNFACFSGFITNCDKSETQQRITIQRSFLFRYRTLFDVTNSAERVTSVKLNCG